MSIVWACARPRGVVKIMRGRGGIEGTRDQLCTRKRQVDKLSFTVSLLFIFSVAIKKINKSEFFHQPERYNYIQRNIL